MLHSAISDVPTQKSLKNSEVNQNSALTACQAWQYKQEITTVPVIEDLPCPLAAFHMFWDSQAKASQLSGKEEMEQIKKES